MAGALSLLGLPAAVSRRRPPGSVNSWADFSSATETAKWPTTSRSRPPVTPMRACGTSPSIASNSAACPAGTATSARALDSEKSAVNASSGLPSASAPTRSRPSTVDADAVTHARLGERDGEATLGEVVRRLDDAGAGRLDEDPAERLLGREVDLRRQAAEVLVDDVRPLGAVRHSIRCVGGYFTVAASPPVGFGT